MQLADLLKFGLDKLFESENSTVTEKDLEKILGGSCNNEWILEEANDDNDDIASCMETDEDENVSSMYVYEGHDYSRDASTKDQQAFDNIMAEMLSEVQSEERLLRSERKASAAQFVDLTARKRKVLTQEELEERRRKREENAVKRAKLKEEEELRKERERQRRLEKLWKDNNYISLNAALDEEEEEEGNDRKDLFEEEVENDQKDIQYVRGDVTHPINTRGRDAIIVHCVDDSGRWGQGGIFTALSRRSLQPETQYELASRMKDLKLGDAHLVPVDDRESRKDGQDYVALIVAQSRDRKNRLSGILLTSLSQGLQRVAVAAKKMKATVHLPRIGYNTPSFNWYGTERLVRKYLASKGIETSIYYFARGQSSSSTQCPSPAPSSNNGETKSASVKSGKSSEKNKKPNEDNRSGDDLTSTRPTLPDFMFGVNALFHEVEEDQRKKLTRYLIAYNGDVSQFANDDVTHVVCTEYEEDNFPSQSELNTGVKIVSVKWLESCFRKGRIVDTRPYKIVKTTEQ
ncbi:unnamed protein product [Porites lobata]|uniref:BRCT domain-containing protein n=1 Tax=Porites lobata TaxID=104759 RepID=A0ABN8PSH5_9CNID|nr:unnamed protein product [Porites lobata]